MPIPFGARRSSPSLDRGLTARPRLDRELIGNPPAGRKRQRVDATAVFRIRGTLSHARAAWVAPFRKRAGDAHRKPSGRAHAASSHSVSSTPRANLFGLARPGRLVRDGTRGTPKSTIGKGLTAARDARDLPRRRSRDRGDHGVSPLDAPDARRRRAATETRARPRGASRRARQREFPRGRSTSRTRFRVARLEKARERRRRGGRRRREKKKNRRNLVFRGASGGSGE